MAFSEIKLLNKIYAKNILIIQNRSITVPLEYFQVLKLKSGIGIDLAIYARKCSVLIKI
jgi:hypothetical protein